MPGIEVSIGICNCLVLNCYHHRNSRPYRMKFIMIIKSICRTHHVRYNSNYNHSIHINRMDLTSKCCNSEKIKRSCKLYLQKTYGIYI